MVASARRIKVESAFVGKYMGCHTLGVFGAFFPTSHWDDLLTFEGLTGVPFGSATVPDDPNRLIVPTLDPDLGIDIALHALGLNPDTWFAPAGSPPDEAVARLSRLLQRGPVLLGPLDMGRLPHLTNRHLYLGCDHYLVARRIESGDIWVGDSEELPLAVMELSRLTIAWGTPVREGRGIFTLRQVPAGPFPLVSRGALREAVARGARQLVAAKKEGPAAYRSLAARESEILRWPAGRRGLSYLICARSQRNLAAIALIQQVTQDDLEGRLAAAMRILAEQVELFGGALAQLLEETAGCLRPMREIASLEARLTRNLAAWLEGRHARP